MTLHLSLKVFCRVFVELYLNPNTVIGERHWHEGQADYNYYSQNYSSSVHLPIPGMMDPLLRIAIYLLCVPD